MNKLTESLQLESAGSPLWSAAVDASGSRLGRAAKSVTRGVRSAVDGVVTFCLVVFEAASGRYDR